jgi:myo-inositol 2-dehydrogenase/D-chiro-inositol 1-dehydrogenase
MATKSFPLKVGIAGLGRLGWRHADNLAHRIPHCELVAACSPVAAELARAESEFGVQAGYSNFDQFLDHPGLDAVVLATPSTLHAKQVETVLRRGLPVFVEKPLALSLDDCIRLEQLAAQPGAPVAMVGFVRRFDTSYQNTRRLIDEGRIGTPFLVRSQTCDMLDPTGAFLQFAPTSGGIFMDCSVHDVDLARWLLGNPRATRAFATGSIAVHPELKAMGDVDNGLAVIEFETGQRAVVYASRTFAHGHETSTEVMGTQGKLLVGAGAARDRVTVSDAAGVGHVAVKDFYERFADAFLHEMEAFVAACREGAPLPLTLNDATEATRITLAITKSLKSGQPEPV